MDPSGNDPLWGVNNDNTGKGNAGSKASYRYGYYDYHTFQKKTKDEETAATEASPDESELVFPMFYRTSTGGLYVAWSEEQIPGCDKGQIEVVGEYENTALENAGETIIDFTNDAVDFFTDPNPHAFRMHHHYRYGRGEPIDVDATTLELDGITQKDLVKVVKTQDLYTLDLFNTQGGSKRYTHSDIAFGTFTLRKDGEDQFSILNDRYDHDMKSWTEKPLRNAATGALFIYDFFAGDPYSTLLLFGLNTYYGWGLYGYDIRFYNKIKIPKGK